MICFVCSICRRLLLPCISLCAPPSLPFNARSTHTHTTTQLDVKGCPDVHASFAEYVKAETLEGENAYDAGEVHGKQDAEKGVRFLAFPPVLHLHLKRFVFDPQSFEMAKVNDAYRFPLVLDVDDYLAEDAEESERNNVYDLHSVLVHSGGVYGGHYNAFVRPHAADADAADADAAEGGATEGGAAEGATSAPKWFCFDDEGESLILCSVTFHIRILLTV